jgi:hypothetical protein
MTYMQCCGSGMFIPDPGSEFFHHIFPDPNTPYTFHPGSRIGIKKLKYFNPKKVFQALGNMIRVVHP